MHQPLAGFRRADTNGNGNESTVFRYIMPDDGDYVLEEDASFVLPTQGAGGPMDIAAASSTMWMVVDNQVRRCGRGCVERWSCKDYRARVSCFHEPSVQIDCECLTSAISTRRRGAAPHLSPACPAQLTNFDLSAAAADPMTFNLSFSVNNAAFLPIAVRVVSSDPFVTHLLVGGLDRNFPTNPGVVVAGAVAVGSSSFNQVRCGDGCAGRGRCTFVTATVSCSDQHLVASPLRETEACRAAVVPTRRGPSRCPAPAAGSRRCRRPAPWSRASCWPALTRASSSAYL